MDKIYSRKRIRIPKVEVFYNNKKDPNYKNMIKFVKITCVIMVACITSYTTIKAISPIIDKQCINMAKSIATNILNEQATAVMSRYKYEDLCNITKDNNGNITMISANVIPINEIISEIPILIQKELNKTENCKFKISLGSFTASRLLSGRGPKIEAKIDTVGNLDTDLKSEFTSAGINQTLHKIYLQVECNMIILTPFDTIEEKIVNQVLLAEAVIVGTTPDTYYNFMGAPEGDELEIIE